MEKLGQRWSFVSVWSVAQDLFIFAVPWQVTLESKYKQCTQPHTYSYINTLGTPLFEWFRMKMPGYKWRSSNENHFVFQIQPTLVPSEIIPSVWPHTSVLRTIFRKLSSSLFVMLNVSRRCCVTGLQSHEKTNLGVTARLRLVMFWIDLGEIRRVCQHCERASEHMWFNAALTHRGVGQKLVHFCLVSNSLRMKLSLFACPF